MEIVNEWSMNKKKMMMAMMMNKKKRKEFFKQLHHIYRVLQLRKERDREELRFSRIKSKEVKRNKKKLLWWWWDAMTFFFFSVRHYTRSCNITALVPLTASRSVSRRCVSDLCWLLTWPVQSLALRATTGAFFKKTPQFFSRGAFFLNFNHPLLLKNFF